MKKRSARPTALFLAMAGAAGIIPNAHADWNVAVGDASTNGAWSGASPDVWTPSASGATVSATEIGTRLGAGTAVTIRTSGGGGAENGDITVSGAVGWSANELTLSAARNIAINANLNGSGTAKLYLQYGFGTGAGGYTLSNGARVNLPAGGNFSTQLNLTGLVAYTVITDLGGAASSNDGTLQGMVGTLGGKYALGADIDASTTNTWNANAGFTPVGTDATKFTGSFDGLGHTVTGLTINGPGWNVLANSYKGLFGYSTGSLSNIGLLNSSISGANIVGALAGRSDGTVSSSYADGGSVSASVHQAGGLVGQGTGSISNSYANVSVTGTNYACCGGGTSSSVIGGLIGGAFAGSISNSYATGSVHGGTYVGGLVGQNSANIDTSYASGAVTATISRGGFIGDKLAGGAITNSYWDSATTGVATNTRLPGNIAGVTDVAAAPNAQASYTGFDFAGSWRIYEGQTRPLLKSFLTPLTVTANNATTTYSGAAYSGGNGVSYSTAPNANLLGTVSYGGTSQGAINVGSYTITPSGLYSNQKGYDITYADGTLTVNVATYAITVNAGAGGTASCTPNPVDHGNSSTCTAIPGAGYSFTGWSGDCAGATCTLSNVTSAKSVTASFALNTYAIAVNAGAGGTASCTPNPVSHGSSSTCTATPNGGYSFIGWSGDCTGATCTLSNVTAAKNVTASFLIDGTKSYTAASATGTGAITASFTGGGAGCGFTVSQYIPVANVPIPPPTGVSFPHGLFDFTTGGCTAASTITLTITYPQALPVGTVYWKYGPSPAGYNCSGASCAVAHWYQMPPAQAVIAGNTVTLTITDGGVGDDDLVANGTIVDQGGPGAGGAAGIPTLSEWGMLLLSLLLAGLGLRRLPAVPR